MLENELLTEIKNDSSAFSKLFNLYYRAIFGYIFRRTGDFDDAADIAADSFLKAFQHIQQFSPRGISVKVWLYRIATNEVNLYYRNQRKRFKLFEQQDLQDAERFKQYIEEDRYILEQELSRHQQFLTILEHLKMLPVKYQEVIALRYFEDKGNKEIADILDTKEGTIKSLLSRGLEKLRFQCNQT